MKASHLQRSLTAGCHWRTQALKIHKPWRREVTAYSRRLGHLFCIFYQTSSFLFLLALANEIAVLISVMKTSPLWEHSAAR